MLLSVKRPDSSDAAARCWRRGRFVGPLITANVLVLGITITLLTAGSLRTVQRQSADRVMDQRTAVARAAVITETGRYRALLQSVAAGVGTNTRFTRTDFDAVTVPLESAGLLGATTVAYVVPSTPERIGATEEFWRGRGADRLALDPRGNPQEHLFSIFARSLHDNEPQVTGIDVAASAEATAALNEARRTGQPTVSDTYVLLRDRALPVRQQQLSFVFVAPVYTPGANPGFQGWMVLGVHGQDFLGAVLSTVSQNQLDGELLATNGDGRRVRVAHYVARGTGDLRRQATFPVANRQWTLVTGADTAYLPGAHSSLPLIVLLGGLALTGILAWLVLVLATGRARARAQVQVATAELRTAEAESRRQAGLLGAIMASLGDGVGVVDANGDFLLHNPAAKALLGVDDVAGPDNWQRHYGLFRPDGRTPFPVEEMPLVRALHGESSDGVEMLIRNPERPDGILVSVDGRPLDVSAGRPGAVAVFRDITELRRYETDLAVFAGVVAHDLKAPLAVVRGHCETADDDLAAAPDSPEVAGARAALGRVMQTVDRMAALIDTLLAYTTSRDAPLRRRTVPLGPLVDDVIQGRTGHLRPGSGPAPDIYVGPLPEVDADPGMLRHVLDNLIGNALKYVPAGCGARIDVTAEAGAPGWTRVEIADRGIGIPDEDKTSIFESFHRAHTAAGYAGTGLGLAICRRIVERHGGVISVSDNPGGGTRFHFTLPLAEPATGEPGTDEPAAGVPTAEPARARPALAGPVAAGSVAAASDAPGPDPDAADRAPLARALAERDAVTAAHLPALRSQIPARPHRA
jgi:signal transduction histidine kinase